jgi:hypothetical protein
VHYSGLQMEGFGIIDEGEEPSGQDVWLLLQPV